MLASKAAVRIRSEETLEHLAQRLQEALPTPPFWFDSDREPPHLVTAMTECLGFEIWLRASASGLPGYVLILEPSIDLRDHGDANLTDISEWFAKHIRTVTDLDCAPLPANEPIA